MADKRDKPPLQVQGWVNDRITITVARSYSQMIRGARLPSPLQEQEPYWDLESGIGLSGQTARPGKTTYEAADESYPHRGTPTPQLSTPQDKMGEEKQNLRKIARKNSALGIRTTISVHV